MDHDNNENFDGDKITHNDLDTLLNGGADTTNALPTRSAIVGDYTLVLPTLTEMQALYADQGN